MCGTIFYIKTHVLQDFHICMNVPLMCAIRNKQLFFGSFTFGAKIKAPNFLLIWIKPLKC